VNAARRLRAVLPALLLTAGAAGVGAPGAAAQAVQSAVVDMRVVVGPPPVLAAPTRDLYFGLVGPGQIIDVPAAPPYPAGTWSAGVRFENLRKQVDYSVRFTLPTQVTRGASSIPVSFVGTQFGFLCVWTTSAATCNALSASFSPATYQNTSPSGYLIDIPNGAGSNNTNFRADVYVGGRLTVPNTQLLPGTYTAPLTVTLAAIN
jgi:hypothetical protein